MRKIIKFALIAAIALALIVVSTWVVYMLIKPIRREALSDWIQSQFVSATPNWKTYTSPESGLSLESPFPIEWKTKEHFTNGKGYQIIHGNSQHNRSGFSIYVNSTRYINLKTNPTLKGTEDIIKTTLQSETNFQWKDQATTCSGIPSTIANYSCEFNGNPFHFTDLLVTNKNQSWKVQTESYQKKVDIFNEWSKRVVDSVKIETKNQ